MNSLTEQVFYFRERGRQTAQSIKAGDSESALKKLRKTFGDKLSDLTEVWSRKDGVLTTVWSQPN